MHRCLMICERLPFDLQRNEHGALSKTERFDKVSTSVAAVFDDRCLWLGWPGVSLAYGEDDTPQMVPVRLDSQDFNAHSEFCSNLYGLLHLVTEDAVCDEALWKAYQHVNKVFGERAVEVLQTAEVDLVWIHDYKMMMTAIPIRQAVVEEQVACKLGFFMHAPFPPWNVFELLPWNDELLQGVLACDVVGFDTTNHCRNFISCCQRCLGCRVDHERFLIEHGGRTVSVKPLTVGIPFDRFQQQQQLTPSSKKTIISFDKCLQSVILKLAAFDLLLNNHQEHAENVALLLVITRINKNDVQEKIDAFNRSRSWHPVWATYDYKTRPELTALLQTADVCLITPLNNASSLVAKQYVACQSGEVPGVLLVSSSSGNAETMPEAITVNPNSPSRLAQSLHRSLAMPNDEKVIRMNFLRRREQRNDCHRWKKLFLDAVVSHANTGMAAINLDYFNDYLLGRIKPGNDVVLLLDYDGTLAPITPHPEHSLIPEETKAVLQRLSVTDGCYLAVISGRGVNNVMERVGIDGITYAGNHGLEIVFPDGSNFAYPIPDGVCERVEELDNVLRDALCRGGDGAWVENKGTSLTFHYSDGPLDCRKAFDVKAKVLIEKAGFKYEHAHLAVEAKPIVPWNKGRAAFYILEKIYGTYWEDKISVIYAGDDVTDEDAMLLLKGMAATVRVTSLTTTKTSAERRVPNPEAVLAMLKWVERHLSRR